MGRTRLCSTRTSRRRMTRRKVFVMFFANTDEIPKGAITASEDTKQLVKDIEEVTKKDLNGDGIIGEKEE